ncbi:MAG: DUF4440 domain-containing protein [Planctomycetota bacterium]
MSFAACLSVFVVMGPAQEVEPGDSIPLSDRSEVREHLTRYVQAINARDYETLQTLLHPNVTYRDASMELAADNAGSLIAQIREALTGNEDALKATVDSVEWGDEQSVIVRGVNSLGPADEDAAMYAFVVTTQKTNGVWKIRSITETAVEEAADDGNPLSGLAWLEGTWQDQGDGEMLSRIRWLPGGHFLVRAFERAGQSVGFQVIGFDNVEQQVRSWSYFMDGSFGEGTWRLDGSKTYIKSVQRLADGTMASGTYVVERTGEDTVSIQLLGHEVGGEPMPRAEKFIAKRVDDSTSTKGELNP